MSRCRLGVAALAVLLVVSNAWWAYRDLDMGVSLTYASASLDDHRVALEQSLAVIEEASKPEATRSTIVDAALRANGDPATKTEPFEKDGYLWVGMIGLAFDHRGALQHAARAWSPP